MKRKYYCFLKKDWFFEATVPGLMTNVQTGVKIKKEVYSDKSAYQKMEVLDTFLFGRILILDGIIQLSKVDEFIYHEMLVHPAMFYNKNPKKVLIIGGGDGGCLREVLKHPIEEVFLVDIDKKVIEISKKYLPFISKGAFNNKRAKVIVGDGIEFAGKYKDYFDVIILDSTDPTDPAAGLFAEKFYKDVFGALAKGGVLSVQSGCVFEQFQHLKSIYKKLKRVFPSVKIHKASVPCLQCANEYSFTIAGKSNLNNLKLSNLEKRFKKLKLSLEYYSPEIHFTSTVFPKYLKKKLN